MKQRSFFLAIVVLVASLGITSCSNDDDFLQTATVRLGLSADELPDTVAIFTPINVNLHSSVPSSCWKSYSFDKTQVESDYTTYYFTAMGSFINDGGGCAQAIINFDTTFTVTPVEVNPYIFVYYSADSILRADTVFVVPATK